MGASAKTRPGHTSHGTQKVTIHLKERQQAMFNQLRKMLAPERTEGFPLTEVLLYCLEETWKDKIGDKPQANP